VSAVKKRPRGTNRQTGRRADKLASLAKANKQREAISALKADARSGRLDTSALLADKRAASVRVLNLLTMQPRCTLRVALDVLLVCQINGARVCGELSEEERVELVGVVSKIGRGIAGSSPPSDAQPIRGVDRELDRVLRGTSRVVPAVELLPSEFAAARSGLEADPQLLRMVDRLIDAVRLYAERDDGGVRARVVAEQWLLFRNYRDKVASGEYPPPSQRGPAVLE